MKSVCATARMAHVIAAIAAVVGMTSAMQVAVAAKDEAKPPVETLAQVLAPRDKLFVGVNYQPIDRSADEVHRDIAMMKKAGFRIVRMGDLSWDSFEPEEGKFEFAWFDAVVDEMHANGIQVLLDVAGLPAPMWLHHKYPGVDIVDQAGTKLAPAERYMDNISDPDYRRRVVIFAEALLKRYGKHPAVLVIGYDNEIGNGFKSYSEADRLRFVEWLKTRYRSLDKLNAAWATQRWSRRIGTWEEVRLPYPDGPGPAERYLDLHRYWSDVAISALGDLEQVRKRYAPDKPTASNFFPYAPRQSFDYLASYRQYTSYGGYGFYPGEIVATTFKATMQRGGLDTPLWFVEFTPGGIGGGAGTYGIKGKPRMWAHYGLIHGVQTVLGWTFNTHLGGEEQALFGLVNHDNTPSWKLEEFAKIASEFSALEKLGFPRPVHPEVAIAYSYESRIASEPNGPTNTVRRYIRTPYIDQSYAALTPLLQANVDAAIIDVANENLERYKLIIVPGMYVMNDQSAKALRNFVTQGGTAIMTGYSAKVDENNQWFNTALPGRLSDVFGLRTNEFYDLGKIPLKISLDGMELSSINSYYEVLEPTTAATLASFLNVPQPSPAVTMNRFGKGRAIYVATTAQPGILGPLLERQYKELGIKRGPETPAGVYARKVQGRTLYVNTTDQAQTISIGEAQRGLLTGKSYTGTAILAPLGVDLIE